MAVFNLLPASQRFCKRSNGISSVSNHTCSSGKKLFSYRFLKCSVKIPIFCIPSKIVPTHHFLVWQVNCRPCSILWWQDLEFLVWKIFNVLVNVETLYFLISCVSLDNNDPKYYFGFPLCYFSNVTLRRGKKCILLLNFNVSPRRFEYPCCRSVNKSE